MGATMARLTKVSGPRGEVRVNSEKRWLKGAPETKMPAGEAGVNRNQGCARAVASGRQSPSGLCLGYLCLGAHLLYVLFLRSPSGGR